MNRRLGIGTNGAGREPTSHAGKMVTFAQKSPFLGFLEGYLPLFIFYKMEDAWKHADFGRNLFIFNEKKSQFTLLEWPFNCYFIFTSGASPDWVPVYAPSRDARAQKAG
jgi:hypothetical protein